MVVAGAGVLLPGADPEKVEEVVRQAGM